MSVVWLNLGCHRSGMTDTPIFDRISEETGVVLADTLARCAQLSVFRYSSPSPVVTSPWLSGKPKRKNGSRSRDTVNR